MTPWSSRAAQVALVTERERSVIRRASGWGEGDGAGGTEEAGPWLPGIRSWRKCTGNTRSFPTTKLHREPQPHFPSTAEDSAWRGRSSSLDGEAGVRSGLTASLRTEGTHSTPH